MGGQKKKKKTNEEYFLRQEGEGSVLWKTVLSHRGKQQ